MLVRVDGTHVAWNVIDGRLHDRPVVGRGVDHRAVAGRYADVRDAVAVLVEEHQVAGFRVRGRAVSVLAARGVGKVYAEVSEHRRGETRAVHTRSPIRRTDVGSGVINDCLSRDVRVRFVW